MNPRLNSGRKAGDQPALTLRSPRSVVAALAPPIDVEAEPIRLLAQALQNLTHPQLNLLSRYDVQVSTPNGFPQLVYQWSTFHATLVPLANLLNMMQIDNIDRLKPFIKLTPAVTDSQQRLQFYNDFIYAFRLQNLTNASDWVGVRHKVTEFADHALDQIIKKSPEKMPVRYAYSIIEAHTFPATRQYPARNDNLRVGSIVNIGGLLYYINNRPSDFSSGVRYFDGFDDFGSLAYEAAKNRAAANKVMPHKWEAYLAFSHPQLGVSQNLLQKYEVYVDSDTVPTARIHDWPLNCSDALLRLQSLNHIFYNDIQVQLGNHIAVFKLWRQSTSGCAIAALLNAFQISDLRALGAALDAAPEPYKFILFDALKRVHEKGMEPEDIQNLWLFLKNYTQPLLLPHMQPMPLLAGGAILRSRRIISEAFASDYHLTAAIEVLVESFKYMIYFNSNGEHGAPRAFARRLDEPSPTASELVTYLNDMSAALPDAQAEASKIISACELAAQYFI